MSVKINKLEDEAIVVVSFGGQLNNVRITEEAQPETRRRKKKETAPGVDYVILDLSNARPTLNDMVQSLAHARQGMAAMSEQADWRYILAGSDQMVRLAASAIHQEQAGHGEVLTALNVRDAIAYARKHSTRI